MTAGMCLSSRAERKTSTDGSFTLYKMMITNDVRNWKIQRSEKCNKHKCSFFHFYRIRDVYEQKMNMLLQFLRK
ncbi:hypothetical protein COM13_20535 [Bacillus pseudomycoides]|nr:hypothetical protein BLX05_20300 [Bacillus pseudomycoides]PDY00278.1 hypothetical protein COO07_11955 [Bacillus pseudomycoides]PDY08363.1 hypothetical protein COO16_29885 [Bacillus pseudomycoides]PEB41725.1 hypothetical protein COO06_10870 [Bacillus pseudomycoides]PEE07372.1 hypothetical protein CON86_04265 [Bacillus pseudomycoides]